jgi:hypothetical protein
VGVAEMAENVAWPGLSVSSSRFRAMTAQGGDGLLRAAKVVVGVADAVECLGPGKSGRSSAPTTGRSLCVTHT